MYICSVCKKKQKREPRYTTYAPSSVPASNGEMRLTIKLKKYCRKCNLKRLKRLRGEAEQTSNRRITLENTPSNRSYIYSTYTQQEEEYIQRAHSNSDSCTAPGAQSYRDYHNRTSYVEYVPFELSGSYYATDGSTSGWDVTC